MDRSSASTLHQDVKDSGSFLSVLIGPVTRRWRSSGEGDPETHCLHSA